MQKSRKVLRKEIKTLKEALSASFEVNEALGGVLQYYIGYMQENGLNPEHPEEVRYKIQREKEKKEGESK